MQTSYPADWAELPRELMALLDAHAAVMAPPLRRGLATSLILLRNRGSVDAADVVPLFFRLFRCPDKGLRELLYRHVVADVRAANRKRRADALNRRLQAFLHTVLAEPEERCAKKAVALLAELYRRGVWTDARCVNIVAAAAFHAAPAVRSAALRFFLGADEAAAAAAADGDGDDDEDGGGGSNASRRRSAEAQGAVGISKEQVYAAYSKGTAASKRKKQIKLKREISRVKKKARREEAAASGAAGPAGGGAGFAALQLLHDPQGFAEKLFAALQGCALGWDSRLLHLQVLSRVIGTHKLLLLHLYPFLQRYAQPSQRDATRVLAAAAQATHDEVPPDVLAPLLRTLVDAFVHDRARPEVIAVGLAAVREIALRQPLVMTGELLRDLALYKKFKDKGVAAAARGLVMLFRELAPALLEKRDRGKAACEHGGAGAATLAGFGASVAPTRVPGVELLQAAEADDARRAALGSDASGSDDEHDGADGGSGDDDDADGSDGSDEEEDAAAGEDGEPLAGRKRRRAGSDVGGDDVDGGSDDDEDGASSSDDEGEDEEEEDDDDGGEEGSSDDEEEEEEEEEAQPKQKRTGASADAGSLRSLKRAAASAAAAAALAAAPPLESERILGDEDFARIRAIRADNSMQDALRRLGAKRAAAAGAEEIAALLARRRDGAHERRVDPESLLGTHKTHSDKAARMASIMAGREGRAEFGAASQRHKKKTGGTSNKEKAKKKALPHAARVNVVRHRRDAALKGRPKGSHRNKR